MHMTNTICEAYFKGIFPKIDIAVKYLIIKV